MRIHDVECPDLRVEDRSVNCPDRPGHGRDHSGASGRCLLLRERLGGPFDRPSAEGLLDGPGARRVPPNTRASSRFGCHLPPVLRGPSGQPSLECLLSRALDPADFRSDADSRCTCWIVGAIGREGECRPIRSRAKFYVMTPAGTCWPRIRPPRPGYSAIGRPVPSAP